MPKRKMPIKVVQLKVTLTHEEGPAHDDGDYIIETLIEEIESQNLWVDDTEFTVEAEVIG